MDKYMKLMAVKGLIISMEEQLYMRFQKDGMNEKLKEVIVDKYYDAIKEQLDELEKAKEDTANVKVIIINGKKHNIIYNKLSYHKILELAYGGKYINGHYTMTYSYDNGDHRHGGSVTSEAIMTIVDGMIFNVIDTSKA